MSVFVFRSLTAALFCCVVTALTLAIADISTTGQGFEAALSAGVNPEQAVSGRQLYNSHCYFCHGYSGDAQTLAGTFLEPPPRNFTALTTADRTRSEMLRVVRGGRAGTAMQAYDVRLAGVEIEAVVDFIRAEFMSGKSVNMRYHSPENGWEGNPSESPAAAFATGKLAMDVPWEDLSPLEQSGKRLFLSACVTCHDQGRVKSKGIGWEAEAVSYPRGGFRYNPVVDAVSGASVYALHDKSPRLELTERERHGEKLYQENCAFCHGGDGTGRNWIGSFLQPHPRDLTSDAAMSGFTPDRLADVIRKGLPGTSMPAWGAILSDPEIRDIVAYINRAFTPFLQPSR